MIPLRPACQRFAVCPGAALYIRIVYPRADLRTVRNQRAVYPTWSTRPATRPAKTDVGRKRRPVENRRVMHESQPLPFPDRALFSRTRVQRIDNDNLRLRSAASTGTVDSDFSLKEVLVETNRPKWCNFRWRMCLMRHVFDEACVRWSMGSMEHGFDGAWVRWSMGSMEHGFDGAWVRWRMQ